MKIFRNILLAIITFSTFMVYSQEEPLDGNYEIAVKNYTGQNIEVQLHPVSAVYRVVNNPYSPNFDKGFYSLTAKYRNFADQPNYYDYINGVHYVNTTNGFEKVLKNQISSNTLGYQGWNDDFQGINDGAFGTFGYGNYKLIIKNLSTDKIDSCIIMLDYFSNYLSWGTPGDVYFYIYPDNATHRFQYRFAAGYNEYIDVNYDTPDGYTLRSWAPNGLNNPLNRRPKKYGPEGGFELDDLPQTYNPDYFPFDSRKDCISFLSLNYNCDQNQDFPQQVQNEVRFDERQGIIPLNLTIKKKIVTPDYQTSGYPANLLISIEPSVLFKIDKCPAPNPINSGFFLNPYQNTSNGNDLVLRSCEQVPLTTLRLSSGDNYNENSRIRVRNNCKIIAESNTLIDLGDYSQIILDRLENQTTQINSKLLLENNSNLVFGANSEINVNAYGEFVNEGGLISYSQNSNAKIIIQSNGLYEIKPNVTNTHTVNNGGRVLLQGGQLKIGDNSSLVFDGSTSYMQVDAGSSISLGQNAKIEFKNGAYIIANGGTISSLNASTPGRGLVFENSSAQTSISNMTFNNLTNAIYIYNTTVGYSGVLKNISNNIFNGNEFCNYVIEAKNANNLTIAYNQIYMLPSKGIGVLLRYPTELGDGMSASVPYTVNIYNNTIANGNISAAFVCLSNSYAGVNFKYNNCYGSVSHGNINMRQIIGDIKYNTLNSVSGKSLEINQSVPNVLSNTISSSNISVYNYDSYPKFAPVPDEIGDGGWVWVGGKNNITSTNNDNLYFSGGNVLLDWGLNCFYKSVNNFHLHGNIDAPNLSYLVRNNGFNGSYSPVSQLFDVSSGLLVNPYTTGSNIYCSNSTDAGTIWQINDLGNGVYDTLYKTSNTSGYQALQDEVLYSTATQKMILDQNFDAVSYFKSLITGFPGSSYSEACLYSLYSCYQKLDTSSNQGVRDILYTDLKNYLDGRILTSLYSDEFNYTAYNITMMCLASIAEYNDAMSGYEFIALYHPDAYTRLLASWDYAEIQTLLNGSGGISSKEENLTDAEYMKILTKRVNKGINEDPIKKKMKKSFDKVKTEKTAKLEKETLSKTKDENTAKLEVAKMKQKDEMMNTKVTSVMRYSKTLKKEEREKMQIEDILFSRKSESKDEIKVNTAIPVVYSLSQNYPNPFNPTTKINYALPKTGLVTMKIYDVTGREIQTLVNDVKQAGNYTVDFNGVNLSSGVYFYKIQSGDFVSVKRMVLIK